MHVFPHAFPCLQILQQPYWAAYVSGSPIPSDWRNSGLRGSASKEVISIWLAGESEAVARPLRMKAAVSTANNFNMTLSFGYSRRSSCHRVVRTQIMAYKEEDDLERVLHYLATADRGGIA
jgi:hypothetical protein